MSDKSVAVKWLEPVAQGQEPAGYWGYAGSIRAKAVFAVMADGGTTVGEVKRRIHEAKNLDVDKQRVFLFGKELEDDRSLGSYGIGNIEDPLLHLLPYP
mmetsp:Transcript_63276/g.159575  ORF Transcript_63276/g.159575 Transcript_63276/m.159575 type:complete len:99 (-) Transcript_63276:98-394(-)